MLSYGWPRSSGHLTPCISNYWRIFVWISFYDFALCVEAEGWEVLIFMDRCRRLRSNIINLTVWVICSAMLSNEVSEADYANAIQRTHNIIFEFLGFSFEFHFLIFILLFRLVWGVSPRWLECWDITASESLNGHWWFRIFQNLKINKWWSPAISVQLFLFVECSNTSFIVVVIKQI